MKREEGEKRKPNKFFADSIVLKAFIKNKIPNENLNSVGAMSKVAAKLLKDNDGDLEKAKKALNPTSFMKDYNSAKRDIDAKRAAKSAAKA